ncbi:MAG: hypothetical protein L6Q29_00305 [Candidatus Pacebacteria bacterium]|nr:hypothetical protein [Candidatus Paceibacterota bacterium]NUQ57456.1 hypothetical protein [Candidatus Paceibacter sp.]
MGKKTANKKVVSNDVKHYCVGCGEKPLIGEDENKWGSKTIFVSTPCEIHAPKDKEFELVDSGSVRVHNKIFPRVSHIFRQPTLSPTLG